MLKWHHVLLGDKGEKDDKYIDFQDKKKRESQRILSLALRAERENLVLRIEKAVLSLRYIFNSQSSCRTQTKQGWGGAH